MMFKEYVQQDIDNTFENLTEFASTVNINGADVKVTEDKDQLLYRIKKDYESLGIIAGDILFYISVGEYAKIPYVSDIPTVNEAVTYNGRPCVITEVTPQDGMYEITLQRAGGY